MCVCVCVCVRACVCVCVCVKVTSVTQCNSDSMFDGCEVILLLYSKQQWLQLTNQIRLQQMTDQSDLIIMTAAINMDQSESNL